MILTKDELDVAPKGRREPRAHLTTSAECIAALDSAAADACTTLAGTDEAHLQTRWSCWQAARW